MYSKEKGFTLIEVMVAMVVLAIGIMAMQNMQASSINRNGESGELTTKAILAASQAEQIIEMDYDDPALQDVDNDGTNQDNDWDGLDDDDDPNISTTNINENFGLRHSECCPGGVDPRGNAVPGCVEIADQCNAYEDYDIYWNIAMEHPTRNTKKINIIVVKPSDSQNIGNQVNESVNRAEYSYIKTKI